MGQTPNRLRELRETAGLSQAEVATKVGPAVTSGAVSRWERGGAVPGPAYRRRLADVYGVTVDQLGIAPAAATASVSTTAEDYMPDDTDPRVQESHDRWRQTRASLNRNRHALAQVAAGLYPDTRLGTTGLVTHPDWLPPAPVDLAAVELVEQVDAPEPALDGTERETALVRPQQSLVRPYARYTHAIRDLAPPRLFENRMSWRLTDVLWAPGKGRMGFADTEYFAAVDVFEPTAHELAYVALDEAGSLRRPGPVMRDLPYRSFQQSPPSRSGGTVTRPSSFSTVGTLGRSQQRAACCR
jgi:transcriptional regulator with XRE-family HTH domain